MAWDVFCNVTQMNIARPTTAVFSGNESGAHPADVNRNVNAALA